MLEKLNTKKWKYWFLALSIVLFVTYGVIDAIEIDTGYVLPSALLVSFVTYVILEKISREKGTENLMKSVLESAAKLYDSKVISFGEWFIDERNLKNPQKKFINEMIVKLKVFYGFQAQYKDKVLNVYTMQRYNPPGYFVVYEFITKKLPFYFSLVQDFSYLKSQTGAAPYYYSTYLSILQQSRAKEITFKDIDFESKEFNTKWKIFGYDKKLAYQIFDPVLLDLFSQIIQKDIVGVEISDDCIRLIQLGSDRLHEYWAKHYIEMLYLVASQIERNYRGKE